MDFAPPITPFGKAVAAVRSLDLNGNGVPDWEEPIVLELGWRALLHVGRKHFAGTLFHQGLELAEEYRKAISQQAPEVSP